MNTDIWHNIMLEMDMKTLFTFFTINKQMYAIYKDIYFWQQKFAHDNLQYLGLNKPNNIHDWRKEYIISTNLKEELGVFNTNRASVLLIQIDDGHRYYTEDEHCKSLEKYMNINYKNWKLYLRKGDIIENIEQSGYRSEGICMYDGEHIIPLNYEADDYGSPSDTFIVFKDFLPDYWTKIYNDDVIQLNIIKKYISPLMDDIMSSFYWHCDFPPVVIYKEPIIQQVKNRYTTVINTGTKPIVSINFANQSYNIHLETEQINTIVTTGTINELVACDMNNDGIYCYF
jgi:hypothetical protein